MDLGTQLPRGQRGGVDLRARPLEVAGRGGGDLGTTPQGQDLGDLGARYLEVAGWRDLEAQRLKVGSGGHTQREKEEIQSIHHTHTTNI